ncbi:MAG: class I SAM-dependent methyltransferase [Candidatus Kryptoniota bacterium]
MNCCILPTARNPYDSESDIEMHHWWFSIRRKLLRSILRAAVPQTGIVCVDVGCGVGSNIPVLYEAGLHVVGLDRSLDYLKLASRRCKVPLVNADLLTLPFRSNSIPLMIAMDVLEHIDDDIQGIVELSRCLVPGGILIVTVPAYEFLRGVQDIVTHHKRRYTRGEIVRKLNAGGFVVTRSSYFNFFLFFPTLVARRLIRLLELRIETENNVNAPGLNFLLKTIFWLEPIILRQFSLPFGVSVLCVAKKIHS